MLFTLFTLLQEIKFTQTKNAQNIFNRRKQNLKLFLIPQVEKITKNLFNHCLKNENQQVETKPENHQFLINSSVETSASSSATISDSGRSLQK